MYIDYTKVRQQNEAIRALQIEDEKLKKKDFERIAMLLGIISSLLIIKKALKEWFK